jgi:protein gp37
MGDKSKIEWTDTTWNPVTGCTKISPGCQNCYAERMSYRLQAMGQPNYADGFKVKTHRNVLSLPLKWKKPRTIFVNSMSDLFHEDVPASFISKVFEVMSRVTQHTFQVLTKRSENLRGLSHSLPWPENVWTGVTVENCDYLHRIDDLRVTPARIKFVSFEPLLGSIPDIDFTGIDWVIVGGESGPGVLGQGLCPYHGLKKSEISASTLVSLSSSSNGEDSTRKKRGVYWMVERGMICRLSMERES